jgi:hypothetical protein
MCVGSDFGRTLSVAVYQEEFQKVTRNRFIQPTRDCSLLVLLNSEADDFESGWWALRKDGHVLIDSDSTVYCHWLTPQRLLRFRSWIEKPRFERRAFTHIVEIANPSQAVEIPWKVMGSQFCSMPEAEAFSFLGRNNQGKSALVTFSYDGSLIEELSVAQVWAHAGDGTGGRRFAEYRDGELWLVHQPSIRDEEKIETLVREPIDPDYFDSMAITAQGTIVYAAIQEEGILPTTVVGSISANKTIAKELPKVFWSPIVISDDGNLFATHIFHNDHEHIGIFTTSDLAPIAVIPIAADGYEEVEPIAPRWHQGSLYFVTFTGSVCRWSPGMAPDDSETVFTNEGFISGLEVV